MSGEQLRATLKVHRAMRDLIQADLVTLLGITRKRINAIETGKMGTSTVLALKLASVLKVPVEALFSLSSEQS